MTDRELLEMAANAADIRIDYSHAGRGFDVLGNALLDWHNGTKWNPLVDDGDALRLAVTLGITMYPSEGKHDGATTTWAHPDSEWIVVDRTSDPGADMRRAIVLAAAAMSKTPNGEVRCASRLAGEASASTVVLAGTPGRKD